ncbi:MAG: hypothetical protein UX31_C0014G0003 [Candidatus Nomurabacteria bacterium GW2011_GWA1_46_11]|uniref:Uncharacterized protein n=1 Tax=Candidatus Nomurabacteria bacterium GW2011_GWA1_46_11 TaxID=1618732 RepID=A0A0G1NN01_9BACT|nr:MAG: hypothetical protein UW73_C0017G0003 [Microgenomates group bacterium GW2011_GWB1_44_8]KKU21707.1 MAG: hypothetical protein UX31_C0014G0003 [Candidatus Nomurabacteria bacterium GW2011_GWA1_46_11]
MPRERPFLSPSVEIPETRVQEDLSEIASALQNAQGSPFLLIGEPPTFVFCDVNDVFLFDDPEIIAVCRLIKGVTEELEIHLRVRPPKITPYWAEHIGASEQFDTIPDPDDTTVIAEGWGQAVASLRASGHLKYLEYAPSLVIRRLDNKSPWYILTKTRLIDVNGPVAHLVSLTVAIIRQAKNSFNCPYVVAGRV